MLISHDEIFFYKVLSDFIYAACKTVKISTLVLVTANRDATEKKLSIAQSINRAVGLYPFPLDLTYKIIPFVYYVITSTRRECCIIEVHVLDFYFNATFTAKLLLHFLLKFVC